MNAEPEPIYILRVRLRSKHVELPTLRKITGIYENTYSFSKGEQIPHFLTKLEKRNIYDTSLIQLEYGCQSQLEAQRALSRVLSRYHKRLLKVGSDKRIDVEVAIEIWEDSPAYFIINQRLVKKMAELGISILIVKG